MLANILSKIPDKHHKALANWLLYAALIPGGIALMMFLSFSMETETSGLFIKTTTYHSLSERIPYLVVAIILSLIAACCLIAALQVLRLRGRYQKYLPMINGKAVIPIQYISDTLNISASKVLQDLHNMIESGRLEGYFIDHKQGLLTNGLAVESVIECPKCGADNKVIAGQVSHCEYCRAKIG